MTKGRESIDSRPFNFSPPKYFKDIRHSINVTNLVYDVVVIVL